jgi:hypothetical protein
MSDLKETGKETKPAGQAAKSREQGKSRGSTKTDLVDRMIEDFEKRLDKGEVKLTVGDFVRLIQLRQDIHEEEPKEIRVTWVEPPEKESVNET